jgi:hypothetical protein
VNLLQGDQVVPLEAVRATSDFFRVFQMEPKIGRGFLPADMTPNAPGVAVLSDAAWRQQFAADPNIVGRPITLGDKQYTVVGVANPDFRLDARVDVWTPLEIAESPGDQSNDYNFVARLKPGVTLVQAQDDLRRVLLQFKSTYPDLWNQYEAVRLVDLHDSLVGQMRPALEMLMGAVGLVLVIVAANILSLLLTRSIARRREMALRAALGATGWRILRQLLVENALLCILGGVIGAWLAEVVTPALMQLSPLPLPPFVSLHMGPLALLFAAGLVLACALLFSLVPAMESRRTQLNESLRINSAQVAGVRGPATLHHAAARLLRAHLAADGGRGPLRRDVVYRSSPDKRNWRAPGHRRGPGRHPAHGAEGSGSAGGPWPDGWAGRVARRRAAVA